MGRKKPSYDFECDDGMIYAAFLQQYRVDLSKCDMHWKEFKALFDNLSDDTQFIKVVQYRNVELSKIKDKEQKAFYRRMKQIYALPDKRTQEEKNADFDEAFGDMFM